MRLWADWIIIYNNNRWISVISVIGCKPISINKIQHYSAFWSISRRSARAICHLSTFKIVVRPTTSPVCVKISNLLLRRVMFAWNVHVPLHKITWWWAHRTNRTAFPIIAFGAFSCAGRQLVVWFRLTATFSSTRRKNAREVNRHTV